MIATGWTYLRYMWKTVVLRKGWGVDLLDCLWSDLDLWPLRMTPYKTWSEGVAYLDTTRLYDGLTADQLP